MSDAIRQHYVPQFYLRQFGDPLNVYDKWKDNPFPAKISDIAYAKMFYEIEGLEAGLLEKHLAEQEARFSRSYNELLEKRDLGKLSKDTRANFFLFLGVQFLRTEEQRLSIKDLTSQAITKLAEKIGFKLPENLMISYDDETIKGMHLEMLIKEAPTIAAIFYRKNWIIHENKTEIPLWTSDNPVTLHNDIDPGPYYGNLGLLSPGIEIRFPLTSELELMSYDPRTTRPKNNDNQLQMGNVIFHNMLQLRGAARFVYSKSDNDFWRARMFINEHPHYKDPRRQRTRVY